VIVAYPDKRLRQIARPVAPEAIGTKVLRAQAEEMKAAGLAHNQIGGDLALAVVPWQVPAGPKTFRWSLICVANPEIVEAGPMERGEEGCLSLAALPVHVDAPKWVRVRAIHVEDGATLEARIEGYPARVWAHEVDHLRGRVLADRVQPPWRRIFLKHVTKKVRVA
jgi:peptide deformylase